jgi:hypothetical protein
VQDQKDADPDDRKPCETRMLNRHRFTLSQASACPQPNDRQRISFLRLTAELRLLIA